ncbi:2-amino-4-hydroxy-6-hydroxymethyldihydropteridine diphosphokinase [Helicobacter pullorum]|uniref:2-amino-4-hydroxy-6- hydroxymethyldihydropteridine diphosphokinase n=1 Tax=Helicobacter pullorum TaxID=35818 RepID=UPI0018F83BE1|nr:2-amino-4-hydroxy-6-hydroxymethyldihydropteridine diphosphokinase [Helicobacter pullorum]
MEQGFLENKTKTYFNTKTYHTKEIKKDFWHFIPLYPKPKYHLKPANKLPRFLLIRRENPYRHFKNYSKLQSYVILGIGSNQGESLAIFWKLFLRLQKKNDIISFSPFLKNPAFGYTKQADFYNGIIWLKTRLGYADFFSHCAYLERNFGRKRKRDFKNAPRTLDIDILGFKNKNITLNHLCIPHKEWAKRESVTIPLKGFK